jgi:hypothetical protein
MPLFQDDCPMSPTLTISSPSFESGYISTNPQKGDPDEPDDKRASRRFHA